MYTANRQVDDRQSPDLFALQAQARALRAEAVAEILVRGLSRIGQGLRKGWHRLEQNRLDRALRRELSRLDAHTLRDLGLSPVAISSVTGQSLADHPLAAVANENARRGTDQGIRTAA